MRVVVVISVVLCPQPRIWFRSGRDTPPEPLRRRAARRFHDKEPGVATNVTGCYARAREPRAIQQRSIGWAADR